MEKAMEGIMENTIGVWSLQKYPQPQTKVILGENGIKWSKIILSK